MQGVRGHRSARSADDHAVTDLERLGGDDQGDRTADHHPRAASATRGHCVGQPPRNRCQSRCGRRGPRPANRGHDPPSAPASLADSPRHRSAYDRASGRTRSRRSPRPHNGQSAASDRHTAIRCARSFSATSRRNQLRCRQLDGVPCRATPPRASETNSSRRSASNVSDRGSCHSPAPNAEPKCWSRSRSRRIGSVTSRSRRTCVM